MGQQYHVLPLLVILSLLCVTSLGCTVMMGMDPGPSPTHSAEDKTRIAIGTATPTPTYAWSGECDPSYPTLCLPDGGEDLNCDDVQRVEFPVLPPDYHWLDRDGDGLGCDSDADWGR